MVVIMFCTVLTCHYDSLLVMFCTVLTCHYDSLLVKHVVEHIANQCDLSLKMTP